LKRSGCKFIGISTNVSVPLRGKYFETLIAKHMADVVGFRPLAG